MDKEVVHIYNGIFLSHKKECIWVSSNEVDKPRAYYTKWNRTERKKQILYINACIWNSEKWCWWISMQGSGGNADIVSKVVNTMRRRGWDELGEQHWNIYIQFSSVAQSCLTLGDPMNSSTSGFPVYHQLLEFTQTHVHWVGDAIQPSHSLLSPSPPALNLSQHQGLFQWVSSLHQVAKVLEFQLQHQSFQWIFRTDFL